MRAGLAVAWKRNRASCGIRVWRRREDCAAGGVWLDEAAVLDIIPEDSEDET
jgi:hypothetical protein